MEWTDLAPSQEIKPSYSESACLLDLYPCGGNFTFFLLLFLKFCCHGYEEYTTIRLKHVYDVLNFFNCNLNLDDEYGIFITIFISSKFSVCKVFVSQMCFYRMANLLLIICSL